MASINEKTLMAYLKKAHSGGGITVRRFDFDNSDYYMFYSGFWVLLCPTQDVPAKALAFVTEHLRRLPRIGEAFMLLKNSGTENLSEDAQSIGQSLVEKIEFMKDPVICTEVLMGECHILQTRDFKPLVVKITDLQMLEGASGCTDVIRKMVMWYDIDRGIYFVVSTAAGVNLSKLEHISRFDYWKEK